jgi:RHS repeat-associated protein
MLRTGEMYVDAEYYKRIEGAVSTGMDKNEDSIVIDSQSANPESTPKALKPRIPSNESVEFKNLQIVYKSNKAILTWDDMDMEVNEFNIYRSKRPYPTTASQHAGTLTGSLKPDDFRNRFVDSDVKNGERYSYRITALNSEQSIIQTSIQLNARQFFLTADEATEVNFSPFSPEDFNKVMISDNDYLFFKVTSDRLAWEVTPRPGFHDGTEVNVRFLNCVPKNNGGEHCTQVDERVVEGYVISRPYRTSLLKKVTARFASLFATPVAYAANSPDDTLYYYLVDHLGGVDAVLDFEGNVVERADYLPFGSDRLRTENGTNPSEAYGFTGKELDAETGLYYYEARYYDPLIGRFVSMDPLVLDEAKKTPETLLTILMDPQSLNAFTYVLNNPVKFVDEFGESAEVRILGAAQIADGIMSFVGSAATIVTAARYPGKKSIPLSTIGVAIWYNGISDSALGGVKLLSGKDAVPEKAKKLIRAPQELMFKAFPDAIAKTVDISLIENTTAATINKIKQVRNFLVPKVESLRDKLKTPRKKPRIPQRSKKSSDKD